jgi:hypothetical protein
MSGFIRLGNICFNPRYIKTVEFEEHHCLVKIANTEYVSLTGEHPHALYKLDLVYQFKKETPEYDILRNRFLCSETQQELE